mgnify:CR=1 FL=1
MMRYLGDSSMKKNTIKKWIKRFSIMMIIVISIIFLVPKIVTYRRHLAKENIIDLALENKTLLDESIQNENYENALVLEWIEDTHMWKNDSEELVVEFYSTGYGIVSASIYTGIYYASSDKPIGFQGFADELTWNKKGWEWKEANGDNWYYTEKIADHWYYYEAGF